MSKDPGWSLTTERICQQPVRNKPQFSAPNPYLQGSSGTSLIQSREPPRTPLMRNLLYTHSRFLTYSLTDSLPTFTHIQSHIHFHTHTHGASHSPTCSHTHTHTHGCTRCWGSFLGSILSLPGRGRRRCWIRLRLSGVPREPS